MGICILGGQTQGEKAKGEKRIQGEGCHDPPGSRLGPVAVQRGRVGSWGWVWGHSEWAWQLRGGLGDLDFNGN